MASSKVIVLANMPMSAVERPSLALSLLKSILTRDGFAATAVYPNMWFLEYVGVADYHLLEGCLPEEALVDWLFSGIAFPDFTSAPDTFLEPYFQRNTQHARRESELRPTFLRLRESIGDFVDWTVDKILMQKPAIVGCTSTFSQHVPSLALLRRLRQRAPDVITLMGGANCETVMGRTTHSCFDWVDYVVSGEADALIAPLLQVICDDGRHVPADLLPVGVFGPVHRLTGYPATSSGDGVPRAITPDMRNLPLPDFSDYFAELAQSLYAGEIYPGLPMEFSRGCWWGERSHCTFCGLNGGSMGYRQKPALQAANDILEVVARYNAGRIEAVDNILALDYIDEALPLIAERDDKPALFFEVKANLKRHEVEKLSSAGVQWIQPGIESLDTRILKLMAKGTTAAHNVQLLKWCRQFGVRVSWSVLWGFPGEADVWYAEMASWIDALHHLQPGRAVRLRFQRYSPYHNKADAYGLELIPASPYRLVYPLPDGALMDLVYYFEDVSEADPGGHRRARQPGERPGLQALAKALDGWLRSWQAPQLPMLAMRQEGDELIVEDTRVVAVAPTQRFRGLDSAILLAADDGSSENALRDSLEKAGHGRLEIDKSITALTEAKLILRLDGRLIGLAVWKPHILMPSPSAFPGGYFERRPGLMAAAS